jgi:hypothetical protein
MAKNSEPQTPEVVANAPVGQEEIPAEVIGNPPKLKTGEITAAEASSTQRTREQELNKTIPVSVPMATPDVVKEVVVAGISGEELVPVKPTKPGPFKIGPKFWRFTVGTTYSVPHFVKQALSRANALSVI